MTAGPPRSQAVVLAAHGERGGDGANRRTLALVEELRALDPAFCVRAGFFKAEPSLCDAIRAAAAEPVDRVIVLPLLMADGYFAQRRLPALITPNERASTIAVAPPIGCEPAMLRLVATRARAMAREREWPNPSVLVVGHGTRAAAASRRTTQEAAAVVDADGFSAAAAFLDDEPGVTEALAMLVRPTIVIPYLWSAGLHGREDIGSLAAEDIAVDQPIGEDPSLAAIIIESLARTAALDPPARTNRARPASAR